MRVEFKKVENKTAEENLRKIIKGLIEKVMNEIKHSGTKRERERDKKVI